MSDILRFYCDTPDGQLHARRLQAIERKRPPLYCLHPAPTSGLYFTTVMPLLNRHRDVIAPDYPGYGSSDSAPAEPSIADYATALGYLLDADDAPVDILGFHTGCLVAAEIALARPQAVRRIVLCDVPYFTADVRDGLREKMARPLPIGPELDSLAAAWDFSVASRLEHVALPRAFELFVEHLRAGIDDHLAFAAAFSYDCESRFAELDADVVVLATDSGMLHATRDAARAIKGATLVDVPEVTTAVFEAGAQPISQRILAALED
ncbi:MAG: alpha/beta fold hydrolase [Woeseiaceae bacterium]|nr:alpha/beta fold hydrolase [Woeseiaceae bacterium]